MTVTSYALGVLNFTLLVLSLRVDFGGKGRLRRWLADGYQIFSFGR